MNSFPQESLKKENTEVSLSLHGSQISLTSRPRIGSGRASVRPISMSSMQPKRPLSAMPNLGHTSVCGATPLHAKKRPQSADNAFLANDEYHLYDPLQLSPHKSLGQIMHGDNFLRLPELLSQDELASKIQIFDEHLRNAYRENINDINDKGLEADFRATYTLPSSHLVLEDLRTENFGRTWTEVEFKEYTEVNGCGASSESVVDSNSDDPCHSEMSLGEKIIAMAQQPHELKRKSRPNAAAKPQYTEPTIQASDCPAVVNCESQILEDNVTRDESQNGNEPASRQETTCLPVECTDTKVSGKCDTDVAFETSCNANGLPILQSRVNSNNCISINVHTGDQPLRTKQNEDSYNDTNENEIQDGSSVNNTEYVPQDYCKKADKDVSEDIRLFSLQLSEYETSINPIDHSLDDIKFHHWFSNPAHSLQHEQKVRNSSHVFQDDKQMDVLQKGLAEETFVTPIIDRDLQETHSKINEQIRSMDSLNNTKKNEHFTTSLKKEVHLKYEDEKGKNKNEMDKYLQLEDDNLSDTNQAQTCIAPEKEYMVHSDAVEDSDTKEINAQLPFQNEKPQKLKKFIKTSKLSTNNRNELLDSLLEEDYTFSTLVAGLRDSSKDCKVPSDNVASSGLYLEAETCTPCRDIPAAAINDLKIATADPAIDATYNDIVNILKVLDHEENESSHCMDKLQVILNTNRETKVPYEGQHKRQSSPSQTKIQDILTYLDEVEHCSTIAVDSAKDPLTTSSVSARGDSRFSENPRLNELLDMSKVDLAHEILTLKLQLEERNNSISMLQQTVAQQREVSFRNSKNAEKELKSKIRGQKSEYETIIGRHQKFIDQIIADKRSLSDKCESLVLELKTSEERQSSNTKALMERHNIELQKAKEMHAVAEKLRRERWIDNKTQKIKEMTVKGLEPELQRMTTRHQQELSDLRTLHKQELEDVGLRSARRATQQMEQLREQFTAEKEEALVKEREVLRLRVEKQTEEVEGAYQEQRRRLLAEVSREKERLAEDEVTLNKNMEEMRKSMTWESSRALEKANLQHEDALEACNRKHQNELKIIRENGEIDREAWIQNYKKQQSLLLSEKESKIRDQYKRERDREIELVIERLEKEVKQSTAEREQATENRFRRLKEKHEAEIKDLEASEEGVKSKYNEVKHKVVEIEDELISVKAYSRQLEKELEEVRKISDRLSSERGRVKSIVRKEFQCQVSSMEQENMKLRAEMAEWRIRHQMELAEKEGQATKILAANEKELQQIYKKVKLAVDKKDETIQHLKRQHKATIDTCGHLEDLLEQQRKDFLLK